MLAKRPYNRSGRASFCLRCLKVSMRHWFWPMTVVQSEARCMMAWCCGGHAAKYFWDVTQVAYLRQSNQAGLACHCRQSLRRLIAP